MKFFKLILTLAVLFCGSTNAAQPFTVGKSLSFESKILQENRTIVVSLPEGYDSSKSDYPVIYLLDGMQNLKHMLGSIDVLTRAGSMPPSIVVGIKSNMRMKDFTPTSVKDTEGSGGGKLFLNFMQSELIPFIEKRYRTNGFRILEGHSIAGLFTAYALMEAPELFDAYIVMAPAFWWDNESQTKAFKTFLANNPNLDKRVYFGVGVEDGNRYSLKRFVKELELSNPPKLNWHHQEFEDEGHMSSVLLINYFALKFIFSDMLLPKSIRSNYTDEQFLAHESMIMEKYGSSARQPQEVYVPLAMELMNQKNYQGAVTVFKRNAQAYESNNYPKNYEWLAEALEKNQQIEEAITVYEKAHAISVETGYEDAEVYLQKIAALTKKLRAKEE